MKLFKKTATCLALTASMVAGMALTQEANALPTHIKHGSPYVNANGLGQVLLFPYYTVRENKLSLFNITNTSSDTVAIKVRFREQLNSRDALDFIVVLSPYDVWTGFVVEADDDSGPVVKSTDNSCVVGAPLMHNGPGQSGVGQPLLNNAFADYSATVGFDASDQGPEDIDRAREGYVTIIGMGQTDVLDDYLDGKFLTPEELHTLQGTVAWNALHKADGVPNNCAAVSLAFAAPVSAPTTLPPVYPFADNDHDGNGDPAAANQFYKFSHWDNPLKGNFSIINSTAGIGAGVDAVAIAGFMNHRKGCAVYGDNGIEDVEMFKDGSCGDAHRNPFYYKNLITAQNLPYSLEPTIASRDGLWNSHGLRKFERAIKSSDILNEWGFNTLTGAKTSWVVTFPSKGDHVDHKDSTGQTYLCENLFTDGPCIMDRSGFIPFRAESKGHNVYSSINPWRAGSGFGIGTVFEDNLSHLGAPVKIDMIGYDREEAFVYERGDNTIASPNAEVGAALAAEANVISFSPAGREGALSSEYSINFDVGAALGNGSTNGWVDLEMSRTTCRQFWPTQYIVNKITGLPFVVEQIISWKFDCETEDQSFPVIGYLFKVRDFGSTSNQNYGQIIDHAWRNSHNYKKLEVLSAAE